MRPCQRRRMDIVLLALWLQFIAQSVYRCTIVSSNLGWLTPNSNGYRVTPNGIKTFETLGIDLEAT